MPHLSIIVPVLNDSRALAVLMQELAYHLPSTQLEILVVDGGSRDDPAAVIPAGVRLLHHQGGNRGSQLALGARAARGGWIWLLHADSVNTAAALAHLQKLDIPCWGRFDVQFKADSAGSTRHLRIVAALMNWRSRLTGICTGDQGIFIHRSLLLRIGGIPQQPLMEDIELCRRLKTLNLPLCPHIVITTDARRWLRKGLIRTIIGMWWFRLRYWLGADAAVLARDYYHD